MCPKKSILFSWTSPSTFVFKAGNFLLSQNILRANPDCRHRWGNLCSSLGKIILLLSNHLDCVIVELNGHQYIFLNSHIFLKRNRYHGIMNWLPLPYFKVILAVQWRYTASWVMYIVPNFWTPMHWIL